MSNIHKEPQETCNSQNKSEQEIVVKASLLDFKIYKKWAIEAIKAQQDGSEGKGVCYLTM